MGSPVVEHLPLAQGMILGSRDQVPHQAPSGEPASPTAYVSASLCLSYKWINKILKRKREWVKEKGLQRESVIGRQRGKNKISCQRKLGSGTLQDVQRMETNFDMSCSTMGT